MGKICNLTLMGVTVLLLLGGVCHACASNEKSSFPQNGNIDGHEYVDLGLPSGNLWAKCNVGANEEFELGYFFHWGETTPSTPEAEPDYKWICKDSQGKFKYSKYSVNKWLGVVDNKTVLETEDDAVAAYWGKNWHMPTCGEYQELIDGCIWKWVDNYYGMEGLLGTSINNSNTIFFPHAGAFCKWSPLQGQSASNMVVIYWTSQLSTEYGCDDCAMTFSSSKRTLSDKVCDLKRDCIRQVALNVRGVCCGKKSSVKQEAK